MARLTWRGGMEILIQPLVAPGLVSTSLSTGRGGQSMQTRLPKSPVSVSGAINHKYYCHPRLSDDLCLKTFRSQLDFKDCFILYQHIRRTLYILILQQLCTAHPLTLATPSPLLPTLATHRPRMAPAVL